MTKPTASRTTDIPEAPYVGWAKFIRRDGLASRLVLCDSDSDGSFKIYRHPPYHWEGGEWVRYEDQTEQIAKLTTALADCGKEIAELRAENARLSAPVSDEEWELLDDEAQSFDAIIAARKERP